MRIEYLCHSSLLVETSDRRLLFDPWWEGPAYCEQWFVFPRPVDTSRARDVDAILISHGHEDHLHEATLRGLSKDARVFYPYTWYGGTKEFLEELGFARVDEAPTHKTFELSPNTRITYVANNLDSIIVVEADGEVLVNVNDSLHAHHPRVIELFTRALRRRWPKVDYVYSGFGGASYFPNCLHAPGKDDEEIARLREQQFAHNFCRIVEGLQPRIAVPFAADFALLDHEKRWINRTRYSREALPAYYREHFVEVGERSADAPVLGVGVTLDRGGDGGASGRECGLGEGAPVRGAASESAVALANEVREESRPRGSLLEDVAATTRIWPMYPGDALEGDALVTESPYRAQLRDGSLVHLLEEQYGAELAEKERAAMRHLDEESTAHLQRELIDNLERRARLFGAERLDSLEFTIRVTDVEHDPCFVVRFRKGRPQVARVPEPSPASRVEMAVRSALLRYSFASDWGGDALVIGYGVEVHLADAVAIGDGLDTVCVRLLTRHPSAKRFMARHLGRAAKFLYTNPLTRKWAIQSLTARSEHEQVYDSDLWLSRSKCEICHICDMPLLGSELAPQLRD